MMRRIRRSVWAIIAVGGGVLMLALGLMVWTSLRSMERLRPIHSHLAHLHALQDAMLNTQELLLNGTEQGGAVDSRRLEVLRNEVRRLAAFQAPLADTTVQRLEGIAELLSLKDGTDARAQLVAVLEQFRVILRNEMDQRESLLRAIDRATRLELLISALVTIALPLVALLFLLAMRRRFLLPLSNLRDLMAALGEPHYPRVATSDLDPWLRPVFDNYNHMATRLAELEKKHRDRQKSLEEEVRVATGALLRQQRQLSQAGRLAAVGELASGVAHELRNPLAGIQMALSGIRHDTEDRDSASRLDMVITELKRVTRLLNDLLNLSRRTPEPPVEFVLDDSVEELVTLVKYQLPSEIRLTHSIPDGLRCRLPEDGVRQALLNLILNAAQAIGDERGDILVRADLTDEHLKICVSDDGPGFPPTMLETGVRAFSTLREGGTGLGLATVRRFARDLGGDISLRNLEPKGACVTLHLPSKVAHV